MNFLARPKLEEKERLRSGPFVGGSGGWASVAGGDTLVAGDSGGGEIWRWLDGEGEMVVGVVVFRRQGE